MIAVARNIAKRLIPESARRFVRRCIDEEYREALGRERARMLTLAVYDSTGGRVVAGPFKDLKYVRGELIGGACKLLGTYERELGGVIEQIVAKGYRTVIDIGAGEGYYVVGLARRMPGTRVVGYEMDEGHQKYIRQFAEANGVGDRVEVHGFCDPASLSECMARAEGPMVIICDVEGCEFDLLDPAAIPGLKNVDVLVELHDMFREGVSKAVKERFSATHKVTQLHSVRRSEADFPQQVKLEKKLQGWAMDEDRGETMYWYWMEAKEPALAKTEEGTGSKLPVAQEVHG